MRGGAGGRKVAKEREWGEGVERGGKRERKRETEEKSKEREGKRGEREGEGDAWKE